MKRRGFTLLEMLVATSVMAIAVVGMLSALSTSLRNANRLTDHDRAALVARRKVDELLLQPRLQRYVPVEGQLTPATDAGLTGGWRATLQPYEIPPNVGPGNAILERLECELWWMDGGHKRTFTIEGYRKTVLQNEDIVAGAIR